MLKDIIVALKHMGLRERDIALASGCSISLISKIYNDVVTNPSYQTALRIEHLYRMLAEERLLARNILWEIENKGEPKDGE